MEYPRWPLRIPEMFDKSLDYLHQNPVTAGLSQEQRIGTIVVHEIFWNERIG